MSKEIVLIPLLWSPPTPSYPLTPGIAPALSSQLYTVLVPVDEMSVHELLFVDSSTQALSEYDPERSHSMSTSISYELLVPVRSMVRWRAPYWLAEYVHAVPGV